MFGSLRWVGLLGAASLVVACVVEHDRSPSPRPGYISGGPTGSSPGAPAADGGTSATSPTPILVDVNNDKTMNASPGEGVGVFIEYGTGGHWHVWWTCDTSVNTQGPLTCDFSIRATVTKGSLTLQKDGT